MLTHEYIYTYTHNRCCSSLSRRLSKVDRFRVFSQLIIPRAGTRGYQGSLCCLLRVETKKHPNITSSVNIPALYSIGDENMCKSKSKRQMSFHNSTHTHKTRAFPSHG